MTQPAANASQPLVQPRLDAGSGFPTLLRKELLRFWKVSFQTIAAPVITALLYLLVFAHVLEGRVMVYGSVPYTAFLIPGLMMMSMLQNAFANPSSSLIQSRITGNLVFMLLPPLSHRDIFAAYVLAAVVRGLAVGLCVWVVALFFVSLVPSNPLWLLVFAVLACGIMGTLGLIAGLWSEKFDQLAAFQNFSSCRPPSCPACSIPSIRSRPSGRACRTGTPSSTPSTVSATDSSRCRTSPPGAAWRW